MMHVCELYVYVYICHYVLCYVSGFVCMSLCTYICILFSLLVFMYACIYTAGTGDNLLDEWLNDVDDCYASAQQVSQTAKYFLIFFTNHEE